MEPQVNPDEGETELWPGMQAESGGQGTDWGTYSPEQCNMGSPPCTRDPTWLSHARPRSLIYITCLAAGGLGLGLFATPMFQLSIAV